MKIVFCGSNFIRISSQVANEHWYASIGSATDMEAYIYWRYEFFMGSRNTVISWNASNTRIIKYYLANSCFQLITCYNYHRCISLTVRHSSATLIIKCSGICEVGFGFLILLTVNYYPWWWLCGMLTSSNGNIFRVTGPLCGEFTGHWWIPLTKANDAELWCFLWSASE